MSFDVRLKFFGVELAPGSPTGFRRQRPRFGSGQIPVDRTSGQIKPPRGLGFGAATLNEFHHPFPQIQRIGFHAHKHATMCPNVNMKCYILTGTIGQADASGVMTGGGYSLTGGYWALFAVQTLGAPLLTITYLGNQAIVSWSPSVTGWTLQTNVNLATPTWGNYLGPVVNNSITNSPPKGTVFFRLKQ